MERDLAQVLPDDVLADVLRRLPQRGLAADLLPRSLAGLFVNYVSDCSTDFAELFSRPSTEPTDSYWAYSPVADHCNGLLLYFNGVLNPATGRWAPLPPQHPPPHVALGPLRVRQDSFLVFDPTLSLRYEVFLIPRVPAEEDSFVGFDSNGRTIYPRVDRAVLGSRWPPSPWILNVFSSATGRWEKRSFVRDGNKAAGTVHDMRLDDRWSPRHAVYFHGALYVHCENDFVTRMSLSDNKYQLIKPPKGMCQESPQLHLGKSENGVYCALLDRGSYRLRVWILVQSQSCGQMEWLFKHSSGRGLIPRCRNCVQKVEGPWILHGVGRDENEALPEHESVWNSDDESILHNEESGEIHPIKYLQILGFHPYREIIFFVTSSTRAIAHHWNSSKLEDLGSLYPRGMYIQEIEQSFAYTPCWIGELPRSSKTVEQNK
ncbi:hypothetical protein ACP70R_024849 [Stipagrostis hirtigluma subsp. patula]